MADHERFPERFRTLMQQAGGDAEASRPILALVRSEQWVSGLLEQVLAEVGLSVTRFNILMELAASPRPGLPLSDIARRLLKSASNLTALIDRLEADRLVRRSRHEDDRRVVTASITESGWEALAKAAPRVFEAEQRLLEKLDRSERRQLSRLLEGIQGGRGSGSDGRERGGS